MIDFLKQRKILIIIGILVIILISWKIYDSSNFSKLDENDVLNTSTSKENSEKVKEEEEFVAIHITGEVKHPGVVKVKEGSRIQDIIKAAGGLTENADISNVNLAYIVEDGIKIRIPSTTDEKNKEYISKDIGEGIIVDEENGNNNNTVININTANETELEELPGIGTSIAGRIVEYRNKNGKFKSIEDIKNVTGIGDSKFEKIKDLIKIK